jgi:hypothetical protein
MTTDQPPTITTSDLYTMRVDERIPPDRFLMFEPVIAERDGKRFETLPPSAVLALQKMRDE